MGKFTVIPKDTFDGLQLDAGVLLKSFDPDAPAAPADEDIICATTGGITVTCTPSYSDLGEDVDNCPTNMKELKHLDSWACSIEFTSLGTSAESIRLALGSADVSGSKVTPRKDISQNDFSDIWWVGDRADGGCVAVKLMNALSTGGFSLKTSKAGKGQISCTLTGHVSIDNQNTMPMEFYSIDPEPVLAVLTVASVAGATSGKTAITVSGYTLGSDESYKYKIAATAPEVDYGDSLASGWTAWNGTDEITATTGQYITVAVADSNTNAVAAGSSIITSHS